METIVIAVLSALTVSAVSFIGVSTFSFSQDKQNKLIHYLLSLAAGAMLGNALLHLLPHALEKAEQQRPAIVQMVDSPATSKAPVHIVEHGQEHTHNHDQDHEQEQAHDQDHGHDQEHAHDQDHSHDSEHHHDHDKSQPSAQTAHSEHDHGAGLSVFAILLAGFFTLFAIDLALLNHAHRHDEMKPLGYLVLLSDGLENFLDGLVIGAAFLVGVPAGIAATAAIFLHEVPMELGDYAVLRHSGFSRRKALLLNFASAMVNVVGVVIALFLGNTLPGFTAIATPFAAGAILYLAATGLLPQIRSHGKGWQKIGYFGMTLLGVALMALILLIE
jgi:zinc transporter ZupT